MNSEILAQNIIKEVFTVKKIFALILVVLMLVPFVVACGGNDETTTTEAPTTEAPTTQAPVVNDNTTIDNIIEF